MGGRAAGFRPAVTGGVGLLSPGSDWETDCPDFGRTALRSPMIALPLPGAQSSCIPGFHKRRFSANGGNCNYMAAERIRIRNTWR